jgi:CRP/FNR family transcriptional regulator
VSTEPKTEVAVIPGLVFRKLFGSEPSIQDLTVSTLSTVVFRLMNELEQVHFCKLEHRLTNLILLRASSEGKLRMTQQEMAYNLGTSREVVARLLRDFIAKGFVETQRGSIKIKDAAGMADLIAFNIDIQSEIINKSTGIQQTRN